MTWQKIKRPQMKSYLLQKEKENKIKKATLLWTFDPCTDGITYVYKEAKIEDIVKRLEDKNTVCYKEENKYHIMDRWVNIFAYEVIIDES